MTKLGKKKRTKLIHGNRVGTDNSPGRQYQQPQQQILVSAGVLFIL